jgi:hypothetical protein
MEIFQLVASFIFLAIFSFSIFNLEKEKYAYHISIGIINIYCLIVFIYFISEIQIISHLALANFIISIVFQFDSKFSITKRKNIKLISIGIVWVFTSISILSCFSGFGVLLITITQPISYLFAINLMKNKNDKISLAIYINLFINWGLLVLITLWQISH